MLAYLSYLRVLEGYGVTETVPVLAVNTPLSNRFGTLSAVAMVPDERKGERYVLVNEKDATRASFRIHAKQRGAADLMIPGEVLVVEKVPVLGSGKLDYIAVARLAHERATPSTPVAAA